jgi:ADP-heptose:LPS heptosyltransferase
MLSKDTFIKEIFSFEPFMDTKKNIVYNKILIINLGGIGDVLLSTPSLRALKSTFPQADIYLLVVPRVYEVIYNLPYLKEGIVFYINAKNYFRDLKTLLRLRKMEFDLAINMRTLVSKRSAKKIKFLLDVINPIVKLGRDTEERGYFFDIKIPETDIGKKYEMIYDMETVEALGVEVVNTSIDFNIDDKDITNVNMLLLKEGLSQKDIIIGVHPGGMPCRRWPIENFSQVIEEISRQLPCHFVITGGKNEVDLVKKLIKRINIKVINLAGKLSLKELGALIKRCNLYISNDTGPMHIAAILKTPLVAIFGPGDIARYDPRNISEKAVVLYKRVDCAPCNNRQCKSLKCLRLIYPDEAIEKALHLVR